MPKSARLRTEDVRALTRMLDDCRDLGDDANVWAYHAAGELGRLTGAGNVLVGGLSAPFFRVLTRPPGTPLPDLSAMMPEVSTGQIGWGWENGFDPVGYARLAGEILKRGFGFHPVFDPYLNISSKANGIALSRADIVDDHGWYRTEYYRDFHEPAGGDAILMSYRTAPNIDGVWALVLVRGPGEPDFTPRQKAIVAETNAALVSMVGGPLARFSEPSPAQLPPRARQVLRCLLEGDSDKLIATRLGIGRHTVNQYVKLIFRHFGVITRAELLARWVKRGWGNQCAWADEVVSNPILVPSYG